MPFDRRQPEDVQAAHRFFAVEFNNQAWDIALKDNPLEGEAETAVHLAHASTLHWNAVGTSINRVRALSLLATVYTRLLESREGLGFARQAEVLGHSLDARTYTLFDQAVVWENLARGSALCGDSVSAKQYLVEAIRVSKELDPEDRDYFLKTILRSGKWHGLEVD